MKIYLLGRSLYAASLLAGLLVASFAFFQAIPADPARRLLGPSANEREVQALRRDLGLDRPLGHQLVAYVVKAVRLDFGRSFVDRRPVIPQVTSSLAVSSTLVGVSLLLCLGYLAASSALEVLRGFRWGEVVDFLWVSTPSFLSGVLVSLFAILLVPGVRPSGQVNDVGDVLGLFPAALALALYPMAVLSRIMRREFQRLRRAPHVVAAQAMGLSRRDILLRHMARIGAVPLVAAMSSLLPMLFTGAYVIEVIFSLPATGTLLARSLLYGDWPMIEAIVLVNGLVVIAAQLAADLVYPVLDPRVATSAR